VSFLETNRRRSTLIQALLVLLRIFEANAVRLEQWIAVAVEWKWPGEMKV